VTLAEFLHPLNGASRRAVILATMYYFRFEEGREGATVGEIRERLVKARIVWARKANIAQTLVRSVPEVEQTGRLWSITGTGIEPVRDWLALPDPLAAPPETDADVTVLRQLTQRIPDETTREYIDEALKCLEVGARRAAVVFLWTGAVSAVREAVWSHDVRQIEAALQCHNPRAKFKKRNDFSGVKDADLLQVAQDLAVYDKSEKKRLGEALDLRNDCGHPVKYRPGEKKVSSFIEDLLNIVFV
jgi:hypothetical protein